jgi:hypothetical protein
MPLLSAPEAPTANGLDYVSNNDSLFADSTRVDGFNGTAPTYDMENGAIAGLRMLAEENRVDSVFSANDLTKIIAKPNYQRHPDLVAEQAFPVNAETKGYWGDFAETFDLSDFGQADFVDNSDDFPMVAIKGAPHKVALSDIGIGYKMTYGEYKKQGLSQRSINLEAQKKRICERALRERAERCAFLGHSARQIHGIANNPSIPRMVSPIKFDSTSTPTQIKDVLRSALSEASLSTFGSALDPNAVVGSRRLATTLRNRTFSNTGDNRDSVFKASFEESQVSDSFMFPTSYLDKIGPSGESGMFFYRRDPDSIQWYYPISIEWFPPFLYNGIEIIHLAVGRIGSLVASKPEDCLLLLV